MIGNIFHNSIALFPSKEGGYSYGFQGMEKVDELNGNGNSYITHFRLLDTRLGRWFSVDPILSALESPYVSMGDNPIWFNDVKGDKFTKTAKQVVKKYKGKLKERIKEEKNKLEMYKKFEGDLYKDKIKKAEDNIKKLKGAKKELRKLKWSSQEYNVVFDSNLGAEGKTKFNEKTGAVDVVIKGKETDDFLDQVATVAHEFTHAYQFETGKISLTVTSQEVADKFGMSDEERYGGGTIYDRSDEREAFEREALVMDIEDEGFVEGQMQYYYDSFMLDGPLDTDSKSGKSSYGDMITRELKNYSEGKTNELEVIKGWQKYTKLR